VVVVGKRRANLPRPSFRQQGFEDWHRQQHRGREDGKVGAGAGKGEAGCGERRTGRCFTAGERGSEAADEEGRQARRYRGSDRSGDRDEAGWKVGEVIGDDDGRRCYAVGRRGDGIGDGDERGTTRRCRPAVGMAAAVGCSDRRL